MVNFVLRCSLGFIAVFIGYGFVYGRSIMVTGSSLFLIGTALFLLICLFRHYSLNIYSKYGKKSTLIVYFTFLFVSSVYCSILRIFICENGLPFFIEFLSSSSLFFSFVGVCGVLGQPLPLPAPSNSSSDSSQARWEDFDMGVLQEGWPVTRDFGLEASIRSRISFLENADSVFLLEKPKGEFWAEIKGELDGCSTQEEYNAKLHFENRDLQVREQRHSCYTFWRHLLSEHPALAESAAYNPEEAIIDFVNEERDFLDRRYAREKPSEVDTEEILFLRRVEGDLRDRGVNSVYIRRLLGHSDP